MFVFPELSLTFFVPLKVVATTRMSLEFSCLFEKHLKHSNCLKIVSLKWV